MTDSINKIGVIGAGVMGAQVAAHAANGGAEVVLLDIVPEGSDNRNIIAETAIQKMLKTNPAPFMHKRIARQLTAGNIEDDLELLSDCDWIIEAVIERLDIKQSLYQKIDKVRKKGSIITSNTSTILVSSLSEGMTDQFASDFFITHFFNPPRYMPLLEIVAGEKTLQTSLDKVSEFADRLMGKTIVHCCDSPGFIANRLGVFWLQKAVVEALDSELSIDEIDSIIGRPFGIPKTGVFGLLDLVGLDLMPNVNRSMKGALEKGDPFLAIAQDIPLVGKMIADGYTGRKGKGGFYRLNREGGGKVKESINLQTREYATSEKSSLSLARVKPENLRTLMKSNDPAGHYGWQVMAHTLCYATRMVPEAADNIAAVDAAMRGGYNWKYGPFQLIDFMGTEWFVKALEKDGMEVPELLKMAAGRPFYAVKEGRQQYLNTAGEYVDLERPDGVLLLEDIKLKSKPVIRNASASLWDVGDGVACFEFTSKMNSLDPQTLALLGQSIEVVGKKFKALVIYNEGPNFSVGANIGLAMFAANIAAWGEIQNLIAAGQATYKALKYAPFPVVVAPAGMALGGGCEITLHGDAIQAHSETYMGLVEAGVGVVPGWGGCKEMLARWCHNPKYMRGPMPGPAKVFELVSVATVSKSAMEAKDHLFLRPGDGITMNRMRLLNDAKQKALSMVKGYRPPEPVTFRLPGPAGRISFGFAVQNFRKTGKATPHDEVVAGGLADVLSGGPEADPTVEVSEDQILELEQQVFMKLMRTPGTLDRIEHMLDTGKPLRN